MHLQLQQMYIYIQIVVSTKRNNPFHLQYATVMIPTDIIVTILQLLQ